MVMLVVASAECAPVRGFEVHKYVVNATCDGHISKIHATRKHSDKKILTPAKVKFIKRFEKTLC